MVRGLSLLSKMAKPDTARKRLSKMLGGTTKIVSAAKKALVSAKRKKLFTQEPIKAVISSKTREEEDRELDRELEAVWKPSQEQKLQDPEYQEYLDRCAAIGEQVRQQAGDDVIVLKIEGDPKRTELRIPRAPFIYWCLSRTGAVHLAPPWKPVARSGMRLQLDDPYHTDWMLGAGMDLEEDYHFVKTGPLDEVIYEKRWQIVREYTSYEAVPFSRGNGDRVEGVVGKDILVIPDLRPSRQPEVIKAKAVLTNMGGMLVHLAIVAREENIPMFMIPKATEKFPPGTRVAIYTDTGHVSIMERRWNSED